MGVIKGWFDMYDHSDRQAGIHRAELSGAPCDLCAHVANGTTARAIGFTGQTYVIGCCEACLTSEEHTPFRADCVLVQQPDLLPLFHIPAGGNAVKTGETWSLAQMTIRSEPYDFPNAVISKPELGIEDTCTVFALQGRATLYFKVFARGARFAPFWHSETAAKHARNRHWLDRILFRVLPLTWQDFKELARADNHNYVALQTNTHWEIEIIDPTLNIAENTLQL